MFKIMANRNRRMRERISGGVFNKMYDEPISLAKHANHHVTSN